MPSMPPAAKALLAALGFAERGVNVAVLLALVAAVALAVVVVLSEDGTVIELIGCRMVVLRATPELATVTLVVALVVALVARVELLLVVRRVLVDEEDEVLDVDAVVVALPDFVEIEMEELERVMDAEVGTWTCPSEICVTGVMLVADA